MKRFCFLNGGICGVSLGNVREWVRKIWLIADAVLFDASVYLDEQLSILLDSLDAPSM